MKLINLIEGEAKDQEFRKQVDEVVDKIHKSLREALPPGSMVTLVVRSPFNDEEMEVVMSNDDDPARLVEIFADARDKLAAIKAREEGALH